MKFACLSLLATLAACTSSPPARTGHAGTSGAGTAGAAGGGSGTAGTTGNAGSGPGTAGDSGAAGAAAGTNGTAGAAGATAGTNGTAGAPAGAGGGGAGGSAAGTGGGGAGASGTSGAGGGAYGYKPFVCPPGPYATQMSTKSTPICNSGGFKFNYAYNEGPTWIATQSAFFFSNFIQGNTGTNKSAGDIIKVSLAADGSATCEVWLHDVGCNGLGVAADGNLLGACHGPRAVMKYDVVTKQGTMLATMAGGQMLDAPNDLISTRNGNIYFSNTTYELGGRPQGLGFALVRIDPMGMTTVVQKGQLNGMALSPDEKLLYVVQMGVWNINPDGSPGTKTNMAGPGGDGIAMDCAGNLVNTNNQYGTNAAFGGPDGKTLIVAGGGTNVKLQQMTVPGFP